MCIRVIGISLLLGLCSCMKVTPLGTLKTNKCIFISEISEPASTEDLEQLLELTPRWNGPPFTRNFESVPIKVALTQILPLTGCSYVIDTGVGPCNVIADFHGIPLDQALGALLWQCSLDFYMEGSLIKISTVEKLRALREALRQSLITKSSSGQKTAK